MLGDLSRLNQPITAAPFVPASEAPHCLNIISHPLRSPLSRKGLFAMLG